MSEVTATSKFACPSCGGEAQWNPAKKALVCPFCGTVAPMALPAEGAGPVPEHEEHLEKGKAALAARGGDDGGRGTKHAENRAG